MSKRDALKFLLPTRLGLLGYVLATLVVFAAHRIESIRAALQIPHDFNIGQGALDVTNNVLVDLLGGHTNTLVLGLLWGVVGLVVYIIVVDTAQILGELREDVKARHYVWARGANRNRPLEDFLEQMGVRLLSFIGMIVYLVYAVSYATDWKVGAATAWQRWVTHNEIASFVYLFVISCLVWHGFVLLLRLLTLRGRLLGDS